jgi:glycosyltransferase involved in cell wall biosynthesis
MILMITGVVLAHDESESLDRCLQSLKFCDSLLVIDDNSRDDTSKIAKKYSARVISHPLNNDFSSQRNFALSQIKSGWILFVDADEVVSPELASEISSAVSRTDFTGYYLPRVDYMWDRPVCHGDAGNAKILRLARHGAGEWRGKVHEIWVVDGQVGTLSRPLLHYPHSTVAEFLRHINFYSTLRAEELYSQKHRSGILEIIFFPPLKFLHLYLVKLGFLDGTPGFILAMLMAFNTFLTRGKLYLLYKDIPSRP